MNEEEYEFQCNSLNEVFSKANFYEVIGEFLKANSLYLPIKQDLELLIRKHIPADSDIQKKNMLKKVIARIEANEGRLQNSKSIEKPLLELCYPFHEKECNLELKITKEPAISPKDIIGLEAQLTRLTEEIHLPLIFPQLFDKGRMKVGRMLLFGPQGCGKELLIKHIANLSQCNLITIKGSQVDDLAYLESEEGVQKLFSKSQEDDKYIVYIQDIDQFWGGSYGSGTDRGKRARAEFVYGLENSASRLNFHVICTTSAPWHLTDFLRRRLGCRIYIPLPHLEARKMKIAQLLQNYKHELTKGNIEELADSVDGYSHSDIENVFRFAEIERVKREMAKTSTEIMLCDFPLINNDFVNAASKVKPTNCISEAVRFEKWKAEFC